MTIPLLLAVWLITAATFVQPYRKHIFTNDNAVAAYLFSVLMALTWPWCVFMVTRKIFLVKVLDLEEK